MRLLRLWGASLFLTGAIWSEAPKVPLVPEAAKASAHFDAKVATDAWLATMTSQEKARSDAYFEGGYWLILWDFLYAAAVMVLLLETKLSARLRAWTKRSWLYFLGFSLIVA